MKPLSLIVGCIVLALSTLAISGNVAADQTTLDPFDFLMESYSVEMGDLLTVNWNSDLNVMFTVVGPDGTLVVSTTDTSFNDQFEAPSSGTFLLTWTNMEFSSNSLNYNVSVVPFGDLVDAGLDILWIFVIIAVVVVAAVVVIIVLVVIYRPRHAQHPQVAPVYPPQAYPPAAYPPPQGAPVATNCMACGTPVDPQHAFCQRCGARVR